MIGGVPPAVRPPGPSMVLHPECDHRLRDIPSKIGNDPHQPIRKIDKKRGPVYSHLCHLIRRSHRQIRSPGRHRRRERVGCSARWRNGTRSCCMLAQGTPIHPSGRRSRLCHRSGAPGECTGHWHSGTPSGRRSGSRFHQSRPRSHPHCRRPKHRAHSDHSGDRRIHRYRSGRRSMAHRDIARHRRHRSCKKRIR